MNYYPGLGVIHESQLPDDWVFDTETFYKKYATQSFEDVYADLNYYYSNYTIRLTVEEKNVNVEKMKAAALRYKSRRLEEESRFLDAYILYDDSLRQEMISKAMKIMRDERKNQVMTTRLKFAIFSKLYYFGEDYYYEAFKMAEELLDDLDKVTENEFPEKRYAYGEIGNLFYFFRDYDRAVPILEKALTDKSRYFFDRTNLRSRNTLAVYYRNIGDQEKANAYFLSMLTSPDFVWQRAMFDAIALSNLGGIRVEQGNYEEAIRFFNAAIPVALYEGDYSFASGSIIGLGQCYLALDSLEKARQMIDTAIVYIQDPLKYVSEYRYRDLYPLMSKYYLRIGELRKSAMYADSASMAEKRYQEVFNARIVLKARQEVYETEKAIKDEKIHSQQKQLYLSLLIILLLFLLLGGMLYFHRRLRVKNRQLVRRLREQDALDRRFEEKLTRVLRQESTVGVSGAEQERDPDRTDPLYEQLMELMNHQKVYMDPGLNRSSMAVLMGTNERYLIELIRKHYDQTFSDFLCSYRLRHARQLLSDPKENLTIESIALDSGFGSRKTFHQIFRKHYDLSPSVFRRLSLDESRSETVSERE